jgi:hypothetical protein
LPQGGQPRRFTDEEKYMKRSLFTITLIGVAMLAFASAIAAPDPYAIIDKSIAAGGGWEKIDAVKSRHTVGTLTIEGAGLAGKLEVWNELPDKGRQELDLKVIKQTSGDNGQYAWRIDPNGKLQIIRDSVALKERELGRLMATNEHLKRGSKFFTVTYDRLDTAGGAWCHVLKTTNSINSTVVYDFFDTTSWRQTKSIALKPEGESHTFNSDFRLVNGYWAPFRIETLELPTNQRTSFQITTIEDNQPIDPALFEPPSEQKRDFHFPPGKGSVEVPFQFIELHIYLPLTINGKTKLWVLDSGAGSSVIEADFARELGLKTEGKIIGQGVSNTVDVAFATLPPFELNGLAFDSQKVVAIAINELFRKTAGFEIGGILGYDFLSRLATKVDYANEKLTFYDPDSFLYAGPGKRLDAPVTKSNMLQITLTVDSQYTGPWNLDLGATGLDFFYPYAEQYGLLGRPGIRRVGFGAGGGHTTTMAQFGSIDFAGYTLPKPIVGIPHEKGVGVFATSEITGNAGNDLFRHFVLYLDYAREKVIVEKGANFEKQFPWDHSGLQMLLGEDGRMVAYTVPDGTPAALAGIKEGDVVASIDGKSIEALGGIIKVRELLKGPPGTKLALGLLRDGKPLQVSLTLRDLYN